MDEKIREHLEKIEEIKQEVEKLAASVEYEHIGRFMDEINREVEGLRVMENARANYQRRLEAGEIEEKESTISIDDEEDEMDEDDFSSNSTFEVLGSPARSETFFPAPSKGACSNLPTCIFVLSSRVTSVPLERSKVSFAPLAVAMNLPTGMT